MWFWTATFPIRLAKLLFEFQKETLWYTECPRILYNVRPLPDCNLLCYRRHHSICYTCLFMTPLVVITISLLQ
jgi:hypothetical protein